jgi:hypothetical protein
MCDTNKISGLLAGAKVAYMAALVLLGIVILNSASFFAAAANIPVMVAVILLNATSITLYSFALSELGNCSGTCSSEYDYLRSLLIAMIAVLSGITLLLIALAVVASVPFGGAVAAGATLSTIISLSAGAVGSIEFYSIDATQKYNNCRRNLGMSTISEAILVLSGFSVVLSFLFLGVGASKPPKP